MRKLRDFAASASGTAVAFAMAAALILGGVVGATVADPAYVSDNYRAQVSVSELGTALLENGSEVTDNEGLLAWIATDDSNYGNVKPGTNYAEALSVRNTGNSDEYVRVTVRRYWTDLDGKKLTDRDTSLIDLEFDTSSGWFIDDGSTTDERTVLYYAHVLPVGEKSTTSAFTKSLTISKYLPVMVTQETEEVDGGTVITTYYTYEDTMFVVEADVDAVQAHSPVEAILSAWGVNVTLSGTDISLA